MAFRAGAVDMTSDQLAISSNTITIPNAQTDINIMLPDVGLENWDADLHVRAASTPSRQRRSTSGTPGGGRGHLARQSDITLPQAQYDIDDDAASLDLLSSGMGIASGEFDPDGGLDLGLDLFGEGDATAASRQRRDSAGRLVNADGDPIDRDDLSSLGAGRDAAGSDAGRPSVGDILGATDVTRDESGFDFGADDGGLDLTAAGLDVSASDIAAEQSLSLDDMTPRTKQQVTEAAEKRAADAAAKAAKYRKQLEDRVTELDGAGINALGKRNVDDILTEEQYLPRSRAYAALLSIHNDPAAHFGSLSKGSMSNLFAGSDLDLAPELNNLFVIDLDAHRAAKRARFTPEDDLSVEVGRRAAPEEEDQVDFGFGDETLGLGGGEGLDMPTLDDTMPALDITADESGLRKSQRIQARADEDEAVGGDSTLSQTGILAPLSRLGTPEIPEDVNLETESFTPTSSRLLAAFDARPSDVETAALAAAEDANATQAASAQGWSKNTVRAQRVIRSQLNRDDEDSELRLDQVGANASRRAAAGFFFELLVLGTKDQVELKQDEPYGDIVIKGKAGLWA